MRKTILYATELLIACLMSFMFTGAAAQVSKGKIVGKETRGAWSSFALVQGSSTTFRVFAGSLLQAGDEPVSAIIDLYPPSCTAIFSFQFSFKSPLNVNIPRQPIVINMRVDSKQLYVMSGSFDGVIGDTSGFVSLDSTSEFANLVIDMRRGGTLRAQLSWAAGGIIATPVVPLSGFTYSINRMQQACSEYARPKPPAIPFQTLPPSRPNTPSTTVPSGLSHPI